MSKKLLSLALSLVLAVLGSAAVASAASKAEKEAAFAGKVKRNILKLGTGEAARVKLKLRDKTKLEGYVSEAGADSFTVVDAKGRTSAVVAYAQVKQVQGNNLSTGQKIAIGVGIAVAVLVIAALVIKAGCDGFCE
ncbi:MAG: hypothetical protein LC785_15590 [Acidobacteria bacterium]|nr:hypothetical protein [Acidobacteriota bacterium]MCA1643329.1 hypothetical protein [Acidobacteriota bacterium]